MLKSFLFEADLQKIINSPENSEIVKNLLLNFDKDLNFNKKISERFISWVATQLRKSEKEGKDPSEIYNEFVEKLNKISLMSPSDIQKINPFQLKGPKDLEEIVKDKDPAFLRAAGSLNSDDLEKVYDDDEVLVINVKTFDGSCFLSQKKDNWCTSYNQNYFNNYMEEGPIFRLYFKGASVPEKYKRCSLSTDGGEIMILHYENRSFDPVAEGILKASTKSKILKIYEQKADERLSSMNILELFEIGAKDEIIINKINEIDDVNIKDNDGRTLLFWACYRNSLELASLLLAKGADTNIKDNDGEAPLFWVCFNNNLELASLLLAKGADINIKDNYGRTPLYQACYRNNLELASLLLAKGADVNIKDNYGKTPLYWACFNDNPELASLLLAKGADVNIKDNVGRTPLFWTCRGNNFELSSLLLTKGAEVGQKEIEACRSQEMKDLLNKNIKESFGLKKYLKNFL